MVNELGTKLGLVDLGRIHDAITPDADYYICGPGEFIKMHYAYLLSRNINKDNIHFEEFGPAVLVV